MTDKPQPPVLGRPAPGLVWRKRAKDWVATWQARTDIIKRGYPLRSWPLWIGIELTPAEAEVIATKCQHLQFEMLAWSRGVEAPPPPEPAGFHGNLRSLVHCYRTDPDSPYQKNRYHVRQNRDSMLRRIVAKHGDMKLSEIRARGLLGWHKEWSTEGQRAATGRTFIGQLRALFSFGASLLEDADCERLCGAMSKMRFESTKARTVSLTAEQATMVRVKAREHFGWHSLALAQAFQFECTLRQKDVIGELVPISEPGISDVVFRKQKWLRGLRWEEIDENLILRHVTSKKQKLAQVDLKLAPMVLEELQLLLEEPLIVVNEATKSITVNRSLLPPSGPVILSEINALPWTGNEYRRKWRQVARKCGIPDEVKNMDTRSGAISEAIQAGAPIEFVRHAATHSDVSQTADYDRSQAEATEKVMKLRMANRNKSRKSDD